jgi:hypothetical protein
MMDAKTKARKAALKVIRNQEIEGEHLSENTFDTAIDAFEAALESAGLVLVPREPTEAMLDVAENWNTRGTGREIYRAMIEAASGKE